MFDLWSVYQPQRMAPQACLSPSVVLRNTLGLLALVCCFDTLGDFDSYNRSSPLNQADTSDLLSIPEVPIRHNL